MLIKKKIFHLNYLIQLESFLRIILGFKLCYSFLINNFWVVLIDLLSWNTYSKKLIKTIYCYSLNTKSFDSGSLNSIVLNFSNLLVSFKNNVSGINFYIGFKSIKKFRKDYTVLRSPFVNKKSREQLLIEKYSGTINIIFLNYNFIIIKYLEVFLKKNLKGWVSSQILLKRVIWLKN